MNGASSASRGRRWLMVVGILGLAGAALFSPGVRRSGEGEDRFRIVCTFLPNYVFALNVAAGVPGVEVEMMVPPSVGCPHDYALSARDRKTVETADVIVANGLGVEGFAESLLGREGDRVILLSENCNLLARRGYGFEPQAGGTEAAPQETARAHDEAGHDHDHAGHDDHAAPGPAGDEHGHDGDDHGHGHAHGDESPWNPHVWVSVKEAMTQVRTLADGLSARDPAHAEAYRRNAEAYLERLGALEGEVEMLRGRFVETNIATLHDAFDYLARDLGLNVVTTLERLPGVAPAAGDLGAIVEKIRTHRVAAIFTEPAYSDRLAKTIGRETGVRVAALDPFTSADEEDINAKAYERVMRENLGELKRVLGVRE